MGILVTVPALGREVLRRKKLVSICKALGTEPNIIADIMCYLNKTIDEL